MKILVTGAAGLVGHVLCIVLANAGHDITGFARRRLPFAKTAVGDLRDSQMLKDLITKSEFDLVVNCAALLKKESEDDELQAIYVNAYLPHLLAHITRNTPTQIIQISTDGIFDGKQGPYSLKSTPTPIGMYAKTKLVGELNDKKNLTIRTSIVGPELIENGKSLFSWFMRQGSEVNGYKNVIWNGITSLELANIIEQAIRTGLVGLLHGFSNESISKADLLKEFNIHFRDNRLTIIDRDEPVSDHRLQPSPFVKSLNMPSYDDMIADLHIWVSEHHKLYSHYF